MYKLALAAGALAFLVAPALAAPASTDRPFLVAEEGASVKIEAGDHDRDRHRHVVVVKKHHDEEEHHQRVVVVHHHEHGDHDHADHDHDHAH